MKVAIIGSGGREYALSRKIASSPLVDHVFRLPGSGGDMDKTTRVDIKGKDVEGLRKFALDQRIDLAVVGPEDALALGVVDEFEGAGLKIIGPRRKTAALEYSKIFTRELLATFKDVSPHFDVFGDTASARASIRNRGVYPTVIKVDGLAAGKGAMVCPGPDAVDAALRRIESGEFGEAGKKFVVEEFLEGEEASYIVLVDRKGHILPLAGSQDHKAIFDGDKGPNTGGMGAYSPAPVLAPEVEQRTLDRIVRPTIEAMAERGMPFTGFLYTGLMIDPKGNPHVVEFNVRLGDPETQPIVARLETDIVEVFLAMLDGSLDKAVLKWTPRAAVTVVMAAKGYPDSNAYKKGDRIRGIEDAEAMGAIVDHAGVKKIGEDLFTDGGRVLGVTALGETFEGAIEKAYRAVRKISWGSEYYRTDIGRRALNR
ncbi:MAG: phosphoribosylamine--glycine ligase [Deltaproteobacteria bacterium]|nr:phosphoribosylamine--glycine ligase [Deltaproteobacteria bacterium]